MKFKVSCYPYLKDNEYKIKQVVDVIIKEKFVMIGFTFSGALAAKNLTEFFDSQKFLFNVLDSNNNLVSFIGKYIKCTFIADILYLVFERTN